MSHIASGILGTFAAAFALGAVQLEVASGNDLLGPAMRGDASVTTATRLAVNQNAKGDRAGAVRAADGVTISFRVPGMDNSSIAMRVSAGSEKQTPAPAVTGSNYPKHKMGCEAAVSLLSANARAIPASRCVT